MLTGMHSGKFVLAQLLDLFSRHEFNKCVLRYDGNRRLKTFSCWDQFVVMLFAQLSYRESLRDIESTLRSFAKQLYHVGIRSQVSRSTLADANESRPWQIWADFAGVLIRQASPLYADEKVAGRLKAAVYVFDATTVDLCLKLFRWAKHRRRKSAVKIHVLLNLRGEIPCFTVVSAGSVHEVNMLDQLPLELGAYYVMDRAYVDFRRLHRFTVAQSFFVIRGKNNLDFRVVESRPVDKNTGLRTDQTIRLRGIQTRKKYPSLVRRITFYDIELKKHFVFLTNNFTLAASTICALYKSRWTVELFFKWIKQYLRIKTFFGNSRNAVQTQIWIAICTYVLVLIAKKELKLEPSTGEIMQVLSLQLFEKTPVFEVFSREACEILKDEDHNYLPLFDL